MPQGSTCTCTGGHVNCMPQQSARKVQVTAKVLFGTVNAIANMKQSDKLPNKRSK